MTDNMFRNITVRAYDRERQNLGLTDSAPIAKARANKSRVRTLTVPELDLTAAAEAIAAGQDPAKALQTAAAATHYGEALRAARDLTEVRLWQAVMTERQTILTTIRDRVHTPAIERLTEIAEHISSDASVDSYMENREADKAGMVMEAEDLAKRMVSAYNLRRELYKESSDASHFTGTAAFAREHNALKVLNGYAPVQWRDWITLIKSGATLWFPSWDEYAELHAQHVATPAQQAKAKQDAQTAERRANSPRQTEDKTANHMVSI